MSPGVAIEDGLAVISASLIPVRVVVMVRIARQILERQHREGDADEARRLGGVVSASRSRFLAAVAAR